MPLAVAAPGCASTECERVLVTETLSRLWKKFGARDLSINATPACAIEGKDVAGEPREVRWMATGGVVCSLPAGSASCVAAVEAMVRERTGMPEKEQRLFIDGQLLSSDVMLSDTASLPVLLVRAVSDPRITDLSHFYPKANFDAVPTSGFTMVRKVAQGINGDIYRYRWRRDARKADEDVAVKKLRNTCLKRSNASETDERTAHLEPRNSHPEEDALTEVGVLQYLSEQRDLPKYLLRMLGCFSDYCHTWLVTEFADGGELFDKVAAIQGNEDRVRRYSWQLLEAVEYIHKHGIGHRDISLENLLVKDDTVKLMDFGMAVRSHSDSGTPLRYFRAAGKNFYRAPECYVPARTEVEVVAPSDSQPGDIVMVNSGIGYLCEVRLPTNSIAGENCKSEIWGYAVQPMDIFAAGMAIFIMYCGFPMWKKALLCDPTFAYVHKLGDEGIASVFARWQKPLPPSGAMQLLTSMLRTDDPSKRMSAQDCLASAWFASMRDEQIQASDESPAKFGMASSDEKAS